MATAILHTATVRFPVGRSFEGKHGPRVNVLVTLSNGEEVKLWDNPGGAIAALQKGDTITVIYDGKNYSLAQTEPTQPAPTQPAAIAPRAAAPAAAVAPTAPVELTSQQKRIWATQIEKSADLLRFCYDTALAKFGGIVDDPAEIRALATTLFIQSFR